MKTPKTLPPIIRIAKYTLTDEVRQKSFVVMFVVCAIFIFLIRGCYQGNFMVNGRVLAVDPTSARAIRTISGPVLGSVA